MVKAKVTFLIAIALIAIVCSPSQAQQGYPDMNGEIGAGAGIWPVTLQGSLNFTGQSVSLDLANNLGLGGSTPFFAQARYTWSKKNSLWLSYFTTETSGSRPLSATFTFNNTTFFAQDTLNTKLTLSDLDLTYERMIFGSEKCSLDGLITIRNLDGTINFSDTTLGLSAGQSKSITFPLIGLGLRAQFSDRFRGYALVRWMNYGNGSTNASNTDANAGVKYNFSPNFGLSAGYRYVNLHASNGDNLGTTVDATFSGPEFMLHWNF